MRRPISERRRSRRPSLWVYLLVLILFLPIPLLAYHFWSSSPSPATVSAPTAPPEFFNLDFPVSQATPSNICADPPAPVTRCAEKPPKKLDLYSACFGHLPYGEAPRGDLLSVGQELLRRTAAQKFMEMRTAARKEGVRMYDISGFRDIATQSYLFYEIAAQRGQTLAQRSLVSAPPGFSEHHTGYAIDIGDSDDPSTELRESFERTQAYRWLVQNAHTYGFELSFPRGNVQGIAYEPWHWRFVGDGNSQQIFAVARQCLTIKS